MKSQVDYLDEDPGDEESNDDEFEYRAGHVPHKCTDVVCLLGFFAAVGFLVHILIYAFEEGEIERLYHGIDFRGRLCGLDKGDDNATLGDYLYWCPTSIVAGKVVSLDIQHPVCVDACPTSSSTSTLCIQMPPEITMIGERDAVTGSFSEEVKYVFKPLADYKSRAFAHRYCMPDDDDLEKAVMEALASDHITKAMTEAGEFASAWVPLCFSAFIAFICSYVFLIIVRWLAFCLVILCTIILTLGSYAGGIFFIVAAFHEEVNATNNKEWDIVISVALFIVGIFFTIMACCAWDSIKTAIGCVEAACECMFALPTLLIEPLVNLIFKLTILGFMLYGFGWLISTGEIKKLTLQDVAAVSFPGSSLSGVARSFEYSEKEGWYIVYYVFMIFWCMELMTALGQFVICYSVQLWYFTPYEDGSKDDVPSCAIFRGYCKGIVYHLGSLAFGSLIVALLTLFRTIMSLLSKQAQAAAGGNPVVGCLIKACQCCLLCFQRFIEFLNKNAYMDIAITSSNFCTAARRAMKVIVTNVAAITFLNGATWVIGWLGLAAISVGTGYLSYMMVTSIGPFNDEADEAYVEAPVFFAVICGFIGAVIARAFMAVFDTTADTILYCFAVETERRKAGDFGPSERFAPSKLNDLVQTYSQGTF